MRLVADEGVDGNIVARLRSDGHEVQYVAEMEPGTSDDAVLQRAAESGAVLVTADKDFGELVFRQGRSVAGVVLLRVAGLTAGAKAEICSRAFAVHGHELRGAFAVVSPGLVRIRARRGPG